MHPSEGSEGLKGRSGLSGKEEASTDRWPAGSSKCSAASTRYAKSGRAAMGEHTKGKPTSKAPQGSAKGSKRAYQGIEERQPGTPPAVLSDAQAPSIGMSPRQFREAVIRQNIPCVRLGLRIIVLVRDLERLARVANDDSTVHLHDDEPEDADSMLASLGFTRGAS
jgi:hypothetical protein